MNTHLLLIFIMTQGVMTADQIGPNKDAIIIKNEQETVTLSCSYDTSSRFVYLYWYRQHPNRDLQYLLYKSARSSSGSGNPSDPRFKSTTFESSTELSITGVTLSDSALYYCAMRVGLGPGGLRSPLTFGDPIRLTIIPKDVPDTPPVLSILSSLIAGGQDICLATGFFPREKSMILNGDSAGSLKTDNAALSTSIRAYYYAGFNQKSIQHCKIDQVEATPDSPKTDKTEKENPQTPLICPTKAPGNSPSVSTDTGDPKTNSMTLLVTGLRILLAKCVAINVLMSVKAFLV